MLWLRKSKKGFTLIELMVVVAIIGVLALLGLRVYTGQQQKAKNAIVKANCGTVQTLLQANMADLSTDYATAAAAVTDLDANDTEGTYVDTAGMRNPYGGTTASVVLSTSNNISTPTLPGTPILGCVYVYKDGVQGTFKYLVQGIGGDGNLVGDLMTAQK